MKCLILAGGLGERLWPLSRKYYPKQFINVRKQHSVFQETVARNMPFCDEFIIITNYEYRYIVSSQMQAFQGISYRCIYEEIPRKTTAAILLACKGLPASEYIFVVAADHLIDTCSETEGDRLSYKDAILKAKQYASEGTIALFGTEANGGTRSAKYITGLRPDGTAGGFLRHVSPEELAKAGEQGKVCCDLGLLLFQNGTLGRELNAHAPEIAEKCAVAYEQRIREHSGDRYPAELQAQIPPETIEATLLEKTDNLRAVLTGFWWDDLGSLEDLEKTDLQSAGVAVRHNSEGAAVLNRSHDQAVVVNGLNDVLVINTQDAVYVGKYGCSSELKQIFRESPELAPYFEKSSTVYRSWGYYEELGGDAGYRVRRVTIFPGRTIYSHRHDLRSEHWVIVAGTARVTLNGIGRTCGKEENIEIPAGISHQISNVGEDNVVIIETATGTALQNEDMTGDQTQNLSERQLGYAEDPVIKLLPTFKDNLWGGTKLRDEYGMDCDFEVIAEAWLLSAHPEGQSIVASGRHRGMKLGDYINTVGRELLGWKCGPMQSFPLLIKFIDAKGDLSIQVHPDDDYALANENQYGKNEMWYVIDAEPGAGLYVGFSRDVTREEVRQRVADNTLTEILNFYPTAPGDVFFIPAGTVHAIRGGNLICEIQQSSSITYRLYDYDRRDRFGNPRELHLEKALDVLNYAKYTPEKIRTAGSGKGMLLSSCKYFESVLYEVRGEERIPLSSDSFHSAVCIRGEGTAAVGGTELSFRAGESLLISADAEFLELKGNMTFVLSHI